MGSEALGVRRKVMRTGFKVYGGRLKVKKT
jgi:hypothetical protein